MAVVAPLPSLRIHIGTTAGLPKCSRTKRVALIKCNAKAKALGSSSCDLYDVLGVRRNATDDDIKKAYRFLQKKCHPDIAGANGHAMSTLLNSAYSVLSDPQLRSSYDRARADAAQLEGYTGRPLYSKWFGSADEQKAVFVDELRCVGCLKCAFLAPNTFAIETCYGRARALHQWADSFDAIQDAVAACPVDCISWVERSKLAALEFLMAKQPRFAVRINGGNNAGVRVSNVFVDAERLLRKVQGVQNDAFQFQASPETRAVVEQIKASAKSWFQSRTVKGTPQMSYSDANYWSQPKQGDMSDWPDYRDASVPVKYLNPAKVLQSADASTNIEGHPATVDRTAMDSDNYFWMPVEPHHSVSVASDTTSELGRPEPETASKEKSNRRKKPNEKENRQEIPEGNGYNYIRLIYSSIPLASSMGATVTVGLGSHADAGGRIEEHLAGPLAVELVNSFALRVFLAASAWYIVGLALASVIAATVSFFTKPKPKPKPTP